MPAIARKTKPPPASFDVITEFPHLGLHWACSTGDVGLATYALLNGQPVNSVINGVLPLHAACSGGSEGVVQLLIDHGADVNAPRLPQRYSNDKTRSSSSSTPAPIVGSTGATPLHFAAANGHTHIVRLLLRRGARADRADKHGVTPDMLAADAHPETAALLRDWLNGQDADLRAREEDVGTTDTTATYTPPVTFDGSAYCPWTASSSSSNTRERRPSAVTVDSSRRVQVKASFERIFRRDTSNHSSSHLPSLPQPSAGDANPFASFGANSVLMSNDPVDYTTRRPSLPPTTVTAQAPPARRSGIGRRPRSAGTGADRSQPAPSSGSAASIYAQSQSQSQSTSSRRRLGSKLSLLNLIRKSSDEPNAHEHPMHSPPAAGSSSPGHSPPVTRTTFPSFPGSSSWKERRLSANSSNLSVGTGTQVPPTPTLPSAVEMHNALTRARSGSGNSSDASSFVHSIPSRRGAPYGHGRTGSTGEVQGAAGHSRFRLDSRSSAGSGSGASVAGRWARALSPQRGLKGSTSVTSLRSIDEGAPIRDLGAGLGSADGLDEVPEGSEDGRGRDRDWDRDWARDRSRGRGDGGIEEETEEDTDDEEYGEPIEGEQAQFAGQVPERPPPVPLPGQAQEVLAVPTTAEGRDRGNSVSSAVTTATTATSATTNTTSSYGDTINSNSNSNTSMNTSASARPSSLVNTANLSSPSAPALLPSQKVQQQQQQQNQQRLPILPALQTSNNSTKSFGGVSSPDRERPDRSTQDRYEKYDRSDRTSRPPRPRRAFGSAGSATGLGLGSASGTSMSANLANLGLGIDLSTISSHKQAEEAVERVKGSILEMGKGSGERAAGGGGGEAGSAGAQPGSLGRGKDGDEETELGGASGTVTMLSSPVLEVDGLTPLSARLAAYGESLLLEKRLKEEEQRARSGGSPTVADAAAAAPGSGMVRRGSLDRSKGPTTSGSSGLPKAGEGGAKQMFKKRGAGKTKRPHTANAETRAWEGAKTEMTVMTRSASDQPQSGSGSASSSAHTRLQRRPSPLDLPQPSSDIKAQAQQTGGTSDNSDFDGEDVSGGKTAVPSRSAGHVVQPATAKTPRIVATCATPVRSHLNSPSLRSPHSHSPHHTEPPMPLPMSPRSPRSPPVRGAPPTAPSTMPGDSATEDDSLHGHGPPDDDSADESSIELPMPLTPSATALATLGAPLTRVSTSPAYTGGSSAGSSPGSGTMSPSSASAAQHQKSASKLARMGFATPASGASTPRSVSSSGGGVNMAPSTPKEKKTFGTLRGLVAGLKGKT